MATPDIALAFADVCGDTETARYTLKRKIGSGAFSVVWQMVEKAESKRLVVGKFMDTSGMTEMNRNFALGEADNAAKCTHPNIVEFIECVKRDNGALLLIFEFADAGDLFAQVTARAPNKYFKEQEILIIMTQLCLALNQLHKSKMLHRDLKTPNVFLTMSGLIKLGDFGFSREYDQTVSNDVGKTFCGTPYYLAPELWNSARYGKKADMWSLGVVLYELMALRKPFSGNTMRQLVGNVLEGNIDPLPTHYSDDLRALCTDLLSLDPENRPSVSSLFRREVLRVQGLETLGKNVPRLVTVPERIRTALLEDVQHILDTPADEEGA